MRVELRGFPKEEVQEIEGNLRKFLDAMGIEETVEFSSCVVPEGERATIRIAECDRELAADIRAVVDCMRTVNQVRDVLQVPVQVGEVV